MKIFELFGTVGLEGAEKVNKEVDALGKKSEALGKKLKEIGKKTEEVGKSLSKWVTTPIIAIGTAATKMAMDAVESENLFEVSMGSMADSARKWSVETSKALGLNEYNVRKNVATYNAMLTSMGLTAGESVKMSEGLTQLSYDMASFYNLKPEEAFEKLKSGISGEAEPLKALGILVNDITIKTYAYANGIAKQGAELTEAQKIHARYGAIMEATKNAQGDLARTMDSPTNKLRVMKEQITQLSIQIGMVLLPVLQKILNFAKPIIERVQAMADKFSSFSQETQGTILKILGVIALLGPMILLIGKAVKVIGPLIVAIKAWNKASMLVMGKNVAIIAGIAGMIAIGTALWKSWDGLSKAAKKIWELMGLEIDKLKLNVKISFKKMEVSTLEFIENTVKSLKILEKLPFGIGDSFKEFGKAVTESSSKAKNELTGMNTEMGNLNNKIAGTKLDAWSNAIDGLEEGNKVFLKINETAVITFNNLKDAGEEIKDSFAVSTDISPTIEEKKALDDLLKTYEKVEVVTKGNTEEKKSKTELAKEEREALEREKKALDELVKSYEKESEINSISIDKMKLRQEEIDKELSNLDKNDKSKKNQIKLLEDEKKALDRSIISLENKKTANDTIIESLKDGINPLEMTINQLEKQKKAIDDSLNSLEKQGIGSGKNVENLRVERENLEKNIASIKSKEKITKDLAKQIANGTITQEQAIKLLDKEKISIEEITNAINQYKVELEKPVKLTWQSQLENFWNKFLNSGSKVGNFLKSFQDKFKKTMEDIQKFTDKNPLIVKVAKMTSGAMGKVAKEIGDTMQGILDTVLGKMNFGNVFQSLFKGNIAGTFKNLFGGIIGKSEEQTKTQLASIEEQRKAELEKVEESNQAEIDAINAKYDLLKAQAENSGFSGLMKRFNDNFEKVITKLMPVFDSLFIALDPMIEPMTQILQILAFMLIEILKPMTPLLIKLMEIVGELLQALLPVIEPLIELAVVIVDLVLGVIRPFIPVLRIVAELFGALIRVLKPIFEPFAKLFDAISPLIEPFTKLAELVGLLIKPIEWIVDMFSKITGGVGNVVSGVGGFIGDAIGGVVDFVGGVIGGIGDFFGFANGGLVTGPTKALIGEAGYKEAVIPLKSDVLSYLGQQIAMATPSNGNLNTNSMFDDFEVSRGNGGDIIINLNGDNLVIDDISLQRFARQLFPKLEAERKRRGE